MFQVMEKLGVPNFFINMIRLLFKDAFVVIKINNQVTEPFKLHQGVYQGFPLAPYLSIIVAKALYVTIKQVLRIGILEGIHLPRCNSQHIISQYVEDTSFTMRARESTI